ncbi:BAR domain-containing protein [Basidiobolus ranarum]|uniref:BAR domain-containing protein n=1 Tax=Basidiobolus ranarum TaxID=34480 RepID=A0ABR2WQ20_9FUNG
MDSLVALTQKVNPWTTKIAQSFDKAKQIAQVKFGNIEITQLPAEYNELEKKVDAIRNAHLNMLKITKIYGTENYDVPMQIQNSVVDFSRTVVKRVNSMRGSEKVENGNESKRPKTLAHGLARAAAEGAEKIGTEEPLGAALSKYATIQENIGDARLTMDSQIVRKFNEPFNNNLNSAIQFSLKARQQVNTARIHLDACKNSLKTAKPDKINQIKSEIESAEDQFVAAVQEAMELMKAVVENPEPLRNLSDLVSSQLNFFKEAYELLTDVALDIDEIQVTQEATFRKGRED